MFIWEARHIMKKEEKWKMDFVAPKSVGDVSRIVKIARNFDVPLSVRSGGHSFLCHSIKPGICKQPKWIQSNSKKIRIMEQWSWSV